MKDPDVPLDVSLAPVEVGESSVEAVLSPVEVESLPVGDSDI